MCLRGVCVCVLAWCVRVCLYVKVANAIAYLHSENVIYCDLKPHNILIWPPDLGLSDSYTAKLADYGVSHFALPAGSRHAQGTKAYMGPEVLEAKGRGHATYTAKVSCVHRQKTHTMAVLCCAATETLGQLKSVFGLYRSGCCCPPLTEKKEYNPKRVSQKQD